MLGGFAYKDRDNRAVERFHLREFLRLTPEIAGSQWCYSDKPDLLVRSGHHCIGLEHTQIFRVVDAGPPLQAREALENRLVSKAWSHYSSQVDPRYLHVSVYFDERCTLRKSDVEALAIQLASGVRHLDAVLDAAGTPDKPLSLESWRVNGQWPDLIPPVVQHLFYGRVPSAGFELWSPCRSCMLPDLSRAQVQAELDRKEPKVTTYRAKCRFVWLLLVADGGSPATYQSVEQVLLDAPYESSFDRAFLLESFSGKLHELGLRKSSLPGAPPN